LVPSACEGTQGEISGVALDSSRTTKSCAHLFFAQGVFETKEAIRTASGFASKADLVAAS
jgi:hypothetical protein